MKCNVDIRPLKELADIQTGPFGSQLHKEDYVEVGTPIVTVEHLGNRTFTEQNLPKVSDGDKKRLEKYLLSPGDIVFSRVGSVDRCSYVDERHSGWMFSGRCLRIRPSEYINPLYLYYYFCLEEVRQFVRNIAVGATMPSINTKLLGEVPVSVPSIQTQRRIAAILSSLDDKIELNNKINANLEQQAQALFKAWFVDFEPFGGKMPEDWRRGTIADLGTVVGGSTPSKAKAEYYTMDGIAWITPKDLSLDKSKFICRGENDITELGLRSCSASIMPEGTVLFSSRAPIGYIAIAAGEVTTNQGFKSVVPNPEIGTAFVYYFLNFNLSVIEGMASGSTFKEVSGSTMKRVPALIPDAGILSEFNARCGAIFAQQRALEAQNRALSALRDELLPVLMSDEIAVAENRMDGCF